jgi:hypothetical protein
VNFALRYPSFPRLGASLSELRALDWGKVVHRISIALSTFAIVWATSACAGDFPARKAGLWEVTIAGSHPFKVRQCSDAASDQALAQVGIGLSQDCERRDVHASGDTITVDSVCKAAGKTRASHIVITGSLDSKYTMTVTSQAAGIAGGPPMTLHSEWLGTCAANQRPGDVIMPDGTKVNVLRAADR